MKKIRQNNFRNCPKKGVKRDAIYFVNSLKVFLKMMKQKRPRKKVRNSKKIKIKKKTKKKNLTSFFLFNFSKLPPERCPGGRRIHPQNHQSVFEEDEVEEVA